MAQLKLINYKLKGFIGLAMTFIPTHAKNYAQKVGTVVLVYLFTE